MAEIRIFTYSSLGESNRWTQQMPETRLNSGQPIAASPIRKEYGRSRSYRCQMKATCESGLKRTPKHTNGKTSFQTDLIRKIGPFLNLLFVSAEYLTEWRKFIASFQLYLHTYPIHLVHSLTIIIRHYQMLRMQK